MNQQIHPTLHSSCDILIVGAGPTGLTAALELARHGCTFRLIEKEPARSPYSRALALHARTLELLELSSSQLIDSIIREGYPITGISLNTGAKHPATARFSHLDTNYPYLLIIHQTRTEALLEAHLATLGHFIERGIALKELSQTQDEAIAHLEHADGQIEEVHARYVLGCDGAHSTVRHLTGIAFPGKGYPWKSILGDVKIEGPITRQGMMQYTNERGMAMVFPFQDGYSRVIIIDNAHQASSAYGDLTLDELQESVDAIVPMPTRLSEPRWLTRWSAQLRQATRYRCGKIFLAGDAAHIHSPAGGQGLNTGVQDAYNLAWKLALVLRGIAPESLLDTYQTERHPIGQLAMRSSDLLVRSTLISNSAVRKGRNIAFSTLLPLAPVQHLVSENLSGLAISYHQEIKRQAWDNLFPGQQKLQEGDRIPNVELRPVNLSANMSTSVHLYDLLRQASYALCIVVAPEHYEEDRQNIKNLLDRIRQIAGEQIQLLLILEQGTETFVAEGNTHVYIDFKQQFCDKLQAQHGNVLLIRPDAYLAFRQANPDDKHCLAKLEQWIMPHKQTTEADLAPIH